jgi:hypothetical protein
MAYSGLQAKIQLIIGLAGIKIFCLGILLFASSYMVEDLLKDYGYGYDFGRNHCEYWAALPVSYTIFTLQNDSGGTLVWTTLI